MGDEQERILQMVQDGKISAAEANELLSALGEGTDTAAEAGAAEPLRRSWEIPFFGGLMVALLGALGLLGGRGQRKIIGLGAWGTFVLGVAAAAVGLWSRDVPWLHLRVQEAGGDRIALSFPLPLFLANWAMGLARTYVDEETAAHMESAVGFVEALRREPGGEPFSIQVDEGDGDRVQIYIA